jgi:hypothetical protein
MIRHRELSAILPALAQRGIFAMVVTSGIIIIPSHWMNLPNVIVAVSVDGLPEHHNARRAPATYERILENIQGRHINVHWTITAQMLTRDGYLEEYVRFWSARKEVRSIWVSLYSPQVGEESKECLNAQQRQQVANELSRLYRVYPKLLTPDGFTNALLHPPASPQDCTFSRMSTNYSADLTTRVEPCVFGGNPDCSQCGCSISAAAHWVSQYTLAGPFKAKHVLRASMAIGNRFASLQRISPPSWQRREQAQTQVDGNLVQIYLDE